MLDERFLYNVYLGSKDKVVHADMKTGPFLKFISDHKIDMVLLGECVEHDCLLEDSRFTGDEEFRRFLKNPGDFGFIMLKVPNTDRYLYCKDELVK